MLVLILAAVLYVWGVILPAARTYRTAQRPDDLAFAGLAAEEIEARLNDEERDQPPDYADILTPFFTSDSTIAYLRLWNPRAQLTGEITRLAPGHPQLDGHGQLPDLGVRQALQPLFARAKHESWREPIILFQQLLNEQREVTTRVQAIVEGEQQRGIGARSGLYVLQDDALRLARTLASTYPLGEAVQAMRAASAGITEGRAESLAAALTASEDAEAALTQTLETYRATTDTLFTLPSALGRLAPEPTAWPARLCPLVGGRRVLIPLFTLRPGEGLSALAGAVEIVFYDHPAALAVPIGWRWIPLVLLLLGMLTLGMRPRRRRITTSCRPALE